MIIPGLDRLDGTCVNGELLDSDELWQEHTAELMELLEEENSGRGNAEDRISMMEFCAPYATGARTTLAMRRASVRREWKVDAYAAKTLVPYESRTSPAAAAPVAGEEVLERTTKSTGGKRRRQQVQILPQPVQRMHELHGRLALPGIVLSCANGFVYYDEALRQALQRIKDILANEGGFYCTPEHAVHITIATVQRFRESDDEGGGAKKDVDFVEQALRGNRNLAQQVARGPFKLVLERVVVSEDGSAIIALWRDEERRIQDLRAALGEDGLCERVPNIIHTTLARVSSLPSCSRQDLIARIRGVAEGLELEVKAMDLVYEEELAYMAAFPRGVYAHWNFGELIVEEEAAEEEKKEMPAEGNGLLHWLSTDQAMLVAAFMMVLSLSNFLR